MLSEKVKYKGPWFEVVEMDVDIGNGKIVQWEEIKTKDAVKVVQNLAKVTDWKIRDASKKPRVLTALFGRNEKIEKSRIRFMYLFF